jgi:hypothetical protein
MDNSGLDGQSGKRWTYWDKIHGQWGIIWTVGDKMGSMGKYRQWGIILTVGD